VKIMTTSGLRTMAMQIPIKSVNWIAKYMSPNGAGRGNMFPMTVTTLLMAPKTAMTIISAIVSCQIFFEVVVCANLIFPRTRTHHWLFKTDE
jgi:hypothetical protein